jgi:hypothetical protein
VRALGDWTRANLSASRTTQQAIALLRANPGQRVALPWRWIGPEGIKREFREGELQELIKRAPIRTIAIRSFVGAQHTAKAGRVESYIRKPNLIPKGATSPGGWPIDLPIVMHWEGQNVLWDGNHRSFAQLLLGHETIRVRYVDLDAA